MKKSLKEMARGRAGPDTASRIREVGERLFAAHGIDAVSLRQIAVAAGAGNNNSVQYHFGDKEGLIRAICQARLPALDSRRADLVGGMPARQMDDPAELLRALLLPIAEETDEAGTHRWAAFLMAIDNASGMMEQRVLAEAHAPVTSMIYNRLMNALAPMPPLLVSHRLSVAFRNFFRGLVAIDRDFADASADLRAALLADYLALAVATVREPAPPALVDIMKGR